MPTLPGPPSTSQSISPSSLTTSSPTSIIDIDLEFLVGFAPIIRVGVNACVTEPSLVAMTGTQKYATKPIEILSQDTTQVKFSVSQSWLDHPACYVATDYISTTDGKTCERADNVAPGEIDTYTAQCSNGVAQVTIYVHSSDFDTMEDNAAVPRRCHPVGQSQTVAYTFDVPCMVEEGSDACEPTPELTCDHFDSRIISSEDFEMSEQSWLFAATEVGSRLNLGADNPEVSKTFEVPVDSFEITLEFDFYEIDDLEIDDEVFIRIDDVYLSLVSFISLITEGTKTGAFGELAVSVTTTGRNHKVQLTIPDTWYPDGRLTLGFKVATSVPDSVGFDNVVLSSACAAELAVADPAFCPADGGNREISFEDFENGEADSWTMGLESAGRGFTTFLGRLGRENPEVSKDFSVPDGVGSVVLAFEVYNIDVVSPGDKAYVMIAGTSIDLGLFDGSVPGTTRYNDIMVTKTEGSKRDLGFLDSELDQKFQLRLTIPARWYAGGILEIGFKVDLQQATDVSSAGIDNVRLTAVCESAQRRDVEQAVLTETETMPVAEPDMYGEDGGSYCSTADFPCQGEGNVHVCHYDARRGYLTFCLPEADSDVLRFYTNDYCGPCIGGYGGINMH
jgi:hypothetical protein